MKNDSYSDFIAKIYNMEHACRTVTFQVTDECCLNCSYCYQINKGTKYMSQDVAKQAVDLLFTMYYEDNKNNFINAGTKAIILDFIGGEPFMNVQTMDYIVNYFITQCLNYKHEWLYNFRISVATNGMLYFNPEVQNFIQKYKYFLSMTISIDGPKEIHDSCRVDYNNCGSFDKAYEALQHYRKNYLMDEKLYDNTKVTIAPENLHNLNTIIDFFLGQQITVLYANPVYEAHWTIEQAREYYEELILLANKMLQNLDIDCSRFDDTRFMPKLTTDNKNWCGGDGNMLAFNPEGIAYPCIRYMESSLGCSREPLIIGDVNNGIYNTEATIKIKQKLNAITRKSQSTEECFQCPIASGCAWCSAWNYQENGDPNIRSTNICWMHRAEAIANVYYWNMRYRLEKSEKRFPFYLEQKYALQLISEEEYNTLLLLSQS